MRPIGRLAYFILGPFIYLLSPYGQARIRVVVRHKKKVLLVKSWLSSQKWDIPGGGIGRGERPTMAAVREVYEETGLVIDKDNLKYIGTVEAEWPLKCNLVVYSVEVNSEELEKLPFIRRLEITDRDWHDVKALPEDVDVIVGPAIDKKLDMLRKK